MPLHTDSLCRQKISLPETFLHSTDGQLLVRTESQQSAGQLQAFHLCCGETHWPSHRITCLFCCLPKWLMGPIDETIQHGVATLTRPSESPEAQLQDPVSDGEYFSKLLSFTLLVGRR